MHGVRNSSLNLYLKIFAIFKRNKNRTELECRSPPVWTLTLIHKNKIQGSAVQNGAV